MRLAGVRAVLLAMCLLVASQGHAAGERVKISIERYAGTDENWDQVREKLNEAGTTLSEKLSGFSDSAKYLKRIAIELKPSGTFSSIDYMDSYWKSVDVLEILNGSVDKNKDHQYFVSSRVYLGELQGLFPRRLIHVDVPFTVHSYTDILNSHQAIIAYCLAVDAARSRGTDKALVRHLFQEALNRLTDLKTRGRRLEGDMAELETATTMAISGIPK
jgi:hypothetical protein